MCTLLTLSARSANLESVIGPRPDLEEAGLRVVREILDVHETGRLVNGRRHPMDQARVVDGRLCHEGDLVVAVRTEEGDGGDDDDEIGRR